MTRKNTARLTCAVGATLISFAAGSEMAAGMSLKVNRAGTAYEELYNSTHNSYMTPQQNKTWKRTYPDYPFQNGGGG